MVGTSYEGRQLVKDGREQRRDFPSSYRWQAKPLEDLHVWERKDSNGRRSKTP